MIHALGVVALALYVIVLAIFSLDLWQDRAGRVKLAERFLLAGFIAHTFLIAVTVVVTGSLLPVGRGDFYLSLSWGIPLAYALARRRAAFPIVGAFLSATTILFLASSSYMLHLTDTREVGLGLGFQGLHVFPALVAELCLVVAVVLSVIFSIQERRIRSKRAIPAAFAAPSLELLGTWIFRLVNGGFIAMSFSIVSGSVWALFHNRSIFTSDPFQWMGFLVWVLFAGIHLVRSLRGRSSRTLSRITILAGTVLIMTLGIFLIWGGGDNHATIYLS